MNDRFFILLLGNVCGSAGKTPKNQKTRRKEKIQKTRKKMQVHNDVDICVCLLIPVGCNGNPIHTLRSAKIPVLGQSGNRKSRKSSLGIVSQ